MKLFNKNIRMPIKPKPKETKEPSDIEVGSIHEELEVPVASELVFRKIWRIKNFTKTISKRDLLDSPKFRCSVNGVSTFWNVAVRFWKGPHGKKVTNPLVVCLNLTGCETEETGQARVRFQFGVWNASIKHWECCSISSVVLNLENTQNLLSVGYKSLSILERHMESNSKDVQIMVKLQIIHSDEDVHSLSQDMARLMTSDESKDTVVECACNSDRSNTIKVHSWIVKVRSNRLGMRIQETKDEKDKSIKYILSMPEHNVGLIKELVRYIYTDKVDNAEKYAAKLLPLSARFILPGLTGLCERYLIESLTPSNVAGILLLADQCGCDNLRKAALHYCEDSDEIKGSVHMGMYQGNSLQWKVMEMVNPDLFMEACESIGSSSSNLECSGTSGGSWSD